MGAWALRAAANSVSLVCSSMTMHSMHSMHSMHANTLVRRFPQIVLEHTGPACVHAQSAHSLTCCLPQEIVLEHTAVGDAGLLHLAQLPRLRSLTLSNFISSLGHLSFLPGGPHVR